jgi:hypothetical protein
VSPYAHALAVNLRWQWTVLRRSRRAWLWVVPPVAGPIGSAIADLYLRIPASGTAEVLGLLVCAGLSALVLLDLAALSAGEDQARGAETPFLVLPQSPSAVLGGRLIVVLAGSIGSYALAALAIFVVGGHLTAGGPAPTVLFAPSHLAIANVGLLLVLGGSSSAAAVYSGSSAQGLAAGVITGVVVVGLTAWLLLQHQLAWWWPLGLAVGGAGALIWSSLAFGAGRR